MAVKLENLYGTYIEKRAKDEAKGYQLTEAMSMEEYGQVFEMAKRKGMPNIAREIVRNERLISWNEARGIRKAAQAAGNELFEKLQKSTSKSERKHLRKLIQEKKELETSSIKDILQHKIKYNPEAEISYKLRNKKTGEVYKGTYKMTERKALYTRLKELGLDTKEYFGY